MTHRAYPLLDADDHPVGPREVSTQLARKPASAIQRRRSAFEKVGVTSRGELVAKIFAEHYAESLHEAAQA